MEEPHAEKHVEVGKIGKPHDVNIEPGKDGRITFGEIKKWKCQFNIGHDRPEEMQDIPGENARGERESRPVETSVLQGIIACLFWRNNMQGRT